MKLQIESVKIKNFLSFGDRENVIPFKQGVNIVLGKDLTTGRSNGAGKSSFLESVPFALFGQTHKDIKKEQLINWKSRKGCVVELDFSINQMSYKVVRGIKPDVFDIYQDGQLIDRPPHVREYQKTLEEIIGLNFNTFISLIHSNINSSNKILSMKAGEKRKFMEDVFGLSLYSKMNEKSNEKMRTLRENINDISLMINNYTTGILNTKDQITDINEKIKRLGSSQIELKDAEAEYERLLDKNPDTDIEIQKFDKQIYDIQDVISKDRSRLSEVNNKIKLVNRWIRDIESSLDQFNESKKTEKTYFAFIKEQGDIHSIVDKIDAVKIEIAKFESDLEIKLTKSRQIDLELAKLEAVKDFECPKCGYKGIDNKTEIVSIKKKLIEATNEWQKIKEKLRDFKGKKGDLEQKRDWLLKMQEKIRTDVDPIKLEEDQKRYRFTLNRLTALSKRIEKWLTNSEKHMNFISNEREELRLKKIQIDNHKNKIDALKIKIVLEENARKEFKAIIESNKVKIESLQKDIEKLEKKRNNLKLLVDYFDVIKELCKDENIKQYAISSIMPYLNQQTNHYLSEVGYGFYTIIDKWLEAQIKGPGVNNASYGSLSGGEARGIDLAIQFGLLDIARIQAGMWPDILIMDEILDSSVDSKGISKLTDIIRAKQAQENNKIFVISHREEIGDEFDADYQYFITKDRYSKVEIL